VAVPILGLVKPVYDASELPLARRQAVTPEALRDAWCRAHDCLSDPSQAPGSVLATAARVRDRAAI
jgi:hypothetical protein